MPTLPDRLMPEPPRPVRNFRSSGFTFKMDMEIGAELRTMLSKIAEDVARQRSLAIETMCERMLTTPNSGGIIVTDYDLGGYTVQLMTSNVVPFGEIWYRSSPD